jgi:hypothetical protein
MPFWAVVTEDGHHNASPGAFILGNKDKASILASALRELIGHVPGERWDPNWSIDKDAKEFKAIKEHLQDVFSGKVNKHCMYFSYF